jgi:predicted O-methyltransferase YrrM
MTAPRAAATPQATTGSEAPALPPQAVVMDMMTAAWTSQTVSAVTRLGVPDVIHEHGPLTARELTDGHGIAARPDLLARALRACASVGIFTESADGRFGPTALSEVLRGEVPGSVRSFVELIGGRWWPLIGGLADTLHAGQPDVDADDTPRDPAHVERFAQAMKSRAASLGGVLEHGDFSGARVVVDVGGSIGHLAIALLRKYPHLRAAVLDLPHVIRVAERYAAEEPADLRARLSLVGGDMFVDVPPADTYVIKTVLHDWDDARCVRVLSRCRARLPAGGRVLVVDNVLPPMGDTSATGTKLLDMLMMVLVPGKERVEVEWRALFSGAGLRVASITRTNPRSVESIIEGVPA